MNYEQPKSLFQQDASVLGQVDFWEDIDHSLRQLLETWFARTDLFQQLAIPFGATAAAADWTEKAIALQQSILDGSYAIHLELRNAAELEGAFGAYSPTGTTAQPTIYLNADWLEVASFEDIQAVLLEELGHDFDYQINQGANSRGDEGAIFAVLAQNQELTVTEREKLRPTKEVIPPCGKLPIGSRPAVVFIDRAIVDIDYLIAGLLPQVTYHLLATDTDGIAQITQVLARDSDAEQSPPTGRDVYIVAHGVPGALQLGNTQLSLDTLATYGKQLGQWFADNDSALYLYGCNVAAGDAGTEFLAQVHSLTGASIYASSTLLGKVARGANWDLDVVHAGYSPVGAAPAPFTAEVLASYAGVLAPPYGWE